MSATWLFARSELRRRVGSLAVLLLLVAVVTATVAGSLAGARRSASSFDRMLRRANARDFHLGVYGADPTDQMGIAADFVAKARAIPGVRDVGAGLQIPLGLQTEFDSMLEVSPDGSLFTTIDRPLVLAGRMPDPDRPNEVAVNELAANELGLTPGDVLKAPTLTPTGLRALRTGANFPGFTGPTLDLAVVGVVRGPDDLIGRTKDANPLVIATPALIKKFGDQLAIATVTVSVVVDDPSAFVMLRTLTEPYAARGFQAFAGTAEEEFWTGVRDAIRVLVIGLLVFAALAGLAGLFVIGQATSRQINQRAEELVAGRAMGMTQRAFAVALSMPAALTLSTGTILGVAIAYATSGLFPLAVARRAEVDPGVAFDPLVLVLSAVFITLIGTSWTYLSARRALRTRVSTRRAQPRFASWLGRRSGAAAKLGSQRALGSNTGATQGPSRVALAGAAIGVAGVVAIFVIGSSLQTAITTPAWWGWSWTSMPDARNPNDPQLLARLQNDNDLVAVGVLSSGYVQLNGVSTNAVALETTKGSLALPLAQGRLPISSSEIAVGSTTLERIGIDVGGTVAATSPDGTPVELRVVGRVAIPLVSSTVPGEGAAFTAAGLSALAPKTGIYSNLVLTYAPGTDRVALERRLLDQYQLQTRSGYTHANAPSRLTNMNEVVGLLPALAIFFIGLATLGLFHSLAMSTRNGRQDFGILGALGLLRRNARHVVTWQACITAIVGLAIGIPFGVIVGRAAWNLMVTNIGMLGGPQIPWMALAFTMVVGISTAAAIAWPIGYHFTRGHLARLLRVE